MEIYIEFVAEWRRGHGEVVAGEDGEDVLLVLDPLLGLQWFQGRWAGVGWFIAAKLLSAM